MFLNASGTFASSRAPKTPQKPPRCVDFPDLYLRVPSVLRDEVTGEVNGALDPKTFAIKLYSKARQQDFLATGLSIFRLLHAETRGNQITSLIGARAVLMALTALTAPPHPPLFFSPGLRGDNSLCMHYVMSRLRAVDCKPSLATAARMNEKAEAYIWPPHPTSKRTSAQSHKTALCGVSVVVPAQHASQRMACGHMWRGPTRNGTQRPMKYCHATLPNKMQPGGEMGSDTSGKRLQQRIHTEVPPQIISLTSHAQTCKCRRACILPFGRRSRRLSEMEAEYNLSTGVRSHLGGIWG